MPGPDETDLEMVRRQVREAARRVARQREIVSGLPVSGRMGKVAREVLAQSEETLKEHQAHLARLLGLS